MVGVRTVAVYINKSWGRKTRRGKEGRKKDKGKEKQAKRPNGPKGEK